MPASAAVTYDIGVDIGGTFTDLVCRGSDGSLSIVKVPTTPAHRSQAVMKGLELLEERGIRASSIRKFCHGTTVATNAVLEAKGAKVGLITTAGFRDVLEIGRQLRSAMYDLVLKPQTPVFLAPRHMRVEIEERVSARGKVLKAIDRRDVVSAAEKLVDAGAEAIAVVFLFSFANSSHERLAGEWIAERFPAISISLSHEVDPVFREYERTVTTGFDAYVKPLVNSYLLSLENELRAAGVVPPPQVIQSRGGLTTAAVARQRPVRLLLSGPAAGVVGAATVAETANIEDVITIDVGGTSADIALITGRNPIIRTEGRIGSYDLRVPMVDVNTIGAGGGSIARVDRFANLRVGPHSAGSVPGPACYGLGGRHATVTDASLVLGYLDPSYFGGGLLNLRAELAEETIEREIARPLAISTIDAALGIHRVLNTQMAEAIRLVSVKQGIDPRRFALVPLGGGGGVHATALARDLGIAKIIVPPNPGVLAAAGLLWAPVEHEVSASFGQRLSSLDTNELREMLRRLDERAAELMSQEQVEAQDLTISYAADVCFVGQSYTIEIPFDPDAANLTSAIHDDFMQAHDRIYGHAVDSDMKLVNLRTVHSALARQRASEAVRPATGGSTGLVARRKIVVGEGTFEATIYQREGLRVGESFSGPAIVQQLDTTTVVEPGWTANVDNSGNLILTWKQQ